MLGTRWQFGNVYAVTEAIHRFYADEGLQRECSAFVRLDGAFTGMCRRCSDAALNPVRIAPSRHLPRAGAERRTAPGPNVLFAALASFRHGTTVAAVAGDGRLVSANIHVRYSACVCVCLSCP